LTGPPDPTWQSSLPPSFIQSSGLLLCLRVVGGDVRRIRFCSRAVTGYNMHSVFDSRLYGRLLNMIRNPLAVPVALFGLGEWSRKNWLPVLVQLARWGVIDLTAVERQACPERPPEFPSAEQEGVVSYVAWEEFTAVDVTARWQVAYVVTSAVAHHRVIHSLLEHAPNLKVIVCEKPCGESVEQALNIFEACRRRGVALLVADHYLLRPGIQYLLAHPEFLRAVGEPVRVVATINESKGAGPKQGVITDLLVHLVDLLMVLFPGSHFTPDTSYTAQVLDDAPAEHETYIMAVGSLNLPDGSVVHCALEGGKQLATDNKSITLVGKKGSLHLDLIRNTLTLLLKGEEAKEVLLTWLAHWSYARLILKSLALS
jgi:predicted dehydrogenase